jgi:hypothetical protein
MLVVWRGRVHWKPAPAIQMFVLLSVVEMTVGRSHVQLSTLTVKLRTPRAMRVVAVLAALKSITGSLHGLSYVAALIQYASDICPTPDMFHRNDRGSFPYERGFEKASELPVLIHGPFTAKPTCLVPMSPPEILGSKFDHFTVMEILVFLLLLSLSSQKVFAPSQMQ